MQETDRNLTQRTKLGPKEDGSYFRRTVQQPNEDQDIYLIEQDIPIMANKVLLETSLGHCGKISTLQALMKLDYVTRVLWLNIAEGKCADVSAHFAERWLDHLKDKGEYLVEQPSTDLPEFITTHLELE